MVITDYLHFDAIYTRGGEGEKRSFNCFYVASLSEKRDELEWDTGDHLRFDTLTGKEWGERLRGEFWSAAK